MRRELSCLALLTLVLAACGDTGSTSTEEEDTGGRGRPGSDTGDRDDRDDAGGEEDEDTSSSGDTGGGGGGGRDTGGSDDTSSGGGACNADTVDEAIDCQIAANEGFVDAYCDCFTDVGYDGDRDACIADQPGADAFEPDACVRDALESFEDAAVANSVCYAAAVDDLAACFAVCPPTEEDFNACFEALNAEFDACDSTVPAGLTEAIAACEDPDVEPPSDVNEALAGLEDQRDAWVSVYCDCYGAAEFGSTGACVAPTQNEWNPGLSTCEAGVFAAQPTAALPFLQCLTETFVIAEASCLECPAPGDFEYDLCADSSVDINFCFAEADAELQDALIACGG